MMTVGRIFRKCFPLWKYRAECRKVGQLWLPDVKTFVYSAVQSGRKAIVTAWRRARVARMLGTFGFSDWSFVDAGTCTPYWRQIAADHARLLRAHEPPLLILEDDAEPVDFRGNVRVPVGSQVVYLGGFRSGDSRGTRNARAAGLRPLGAFRYSYLPVDGEWMRVFGMWGTHAVLWLDRAAMTEAAELFESRPEPIDTILACEQHRWQCVCALRPWWFQNDGHHIWDTWDYRPRFYELDQKRTGDN